MDSEQKGNVQLFTGECLFLPVTICVVSEDEEDSWSFSDNSIKEGDYNSSDVDGDLTKLDACTSQEKSRASPYWLVDMNKFQDVQKGASKIVPDAIIQKVIGQKKKLFEENDARLQSKKDSDLKVSKRRGADQKEIRLHPLSHETTMIPCGNVLSPWNNCGLRALLTLV
ncbi:uncharacterized protein [Lepisosteus oculatus]|uniref:uncharacterized protein isoform X3 n=1 Tax=Lepisosteus oculatus TaxID=7918 RepID=UPI00073FB3A7|nr:PREDICTED: uncharacterized protein LOC102695244 isoform X3 [Lepisosteus oculatus]